MATLSCWFRRSTFRSAEVKHSTLNLDTAHSDDRAFGKYWAIGREWVLYRSPYVTLSLKKAGTPHMHADTHGAPSVHTNTYWYNIHWYILDVGAISKRPEWLRRSFMLIDYVGEEGYSYIGKFFFPCNTSHLKLKLKSVLLVASLEVPIEGRYIH